MKLAELKIEAYSEQISLESTESIKGGTGIWCWGSVGAEIATDSTANVRCSENTTIAQDSSGCNIVVLTITCIEQ